MINVYESPMNLICQDRFDTTMHRKTGRKKRPIMSALLIASALSHNRDAKKRIFKLQNSYKTERGLMKGIRPDIIFVLQKSSRFAIMYRLESQYR